MALTEAPFWVWGLIILNSILYLVMSLTPLVGEWLQADQVKNKPRPVPLVVSTNVGATWCRT